MAILAGPRTFGHENQILGEKQFWVFNLLNQIVFLAYVSLLFLLSDSGFTIEYELCSIIVEV